jgi:hypothetical protein
VNLVQLWYKEDERWCKATMRLNPILASEAAEDVKLLA